MRGFAVRSHLGARRGFSPRVKPEGLKRFRGFKCRGLQNPELNPRIQYGLVPRLGNK